MPDPAVEAGGAGGADDAPEALRHGTRGRDAARPETGPRNNGIRLSIDTLPALPRFGGKSVRSASPDAWEPSRVRSGPAPTRREIGLIRRPILDSATAVMWNSHMENEIGNPNHTRRSQSYDRPRILP